jgi:hypothetical protein
MNKAILQYFLISFILGINFIFCSGNYEQNKKFLQNYSITVIPSPHHKPREAKGLSIESIGNFHSRYFKISSDSIIVNYSYALIDSAIKFYRKLTKSDSILVDSITNLVGEVLSGSYVNNEIKDCGGTFI